uniref:Uncharacterized protein n=1 Tax=Rhizophora mucronata TaxID=61149 RepID=A0A2P2PRQ6_RHIMU
MPFFWEILKLCKTTVFFSYGINHLLSIN